MRSVLKLLEIGGDSLNDHLYPDGIVEKYGKVGSELVDLLANKNGFYALKSSLLVRPLTSDISPTGIAGWNSPDLWKNLYGDLLIDCLCFSEDIFGNQFFISRDGVYSFDIETGRANSLGESIDEWATNILNDFNYWTGFTLCEAWQEEHGALEAGQKLSPILPFVLGGGFNIENLQIMNELDAITFAASIFSQTNNLDDGETMTFVG